MNIYLFLIHGLVTLGIYELHISLLSVKKDGLYLNKTSKGTIISIFL